MENFRKKIISWGAKLLLGLLIISFALWGIGDYTMGGKDGDEIVAQVGDQTISGRDLKFRVNNSVDRMRKIFGEKVSSEQLMAMGVIDQTLENLIEESLFTQYSQKLGLIISDEILGTEIRTDKQFLDSSGKFHRDKFRQLINRLGYNEKTFMELYRKELIQRQLLSTINFAEVKPKQLLNDLVQHRGERRTAHIFKINHQSMRITNRPTKQVIDDFYKKNEKRFISPEYRSLTLLTLTPTQIAGEIDILDTAISQEYEDRVLEFSTTETRSIQQIIVPKQEQAKEIIKSLNKGISFLETGKKIGEMDASQINLGEFTKSQLPIKIIAEKAFSLSLKTFSEPIKTSLGWHVIKIDKITPASVIPLSQVKNKIRKEMQLDKATDALVGLANKLEDELGSGATIQEAANTLNLQTVKLIKSDRLGLDDSGKPIKILQTKPEILETAFNTAQNQNSPLTDYDDSSFFILHVNEIFPPKLRPLKIIRKDVIKTWEKEQRESNAAELANKLSSLNKKIKTTKFVTSLGQTKPLTREGKGLDIAIPGDLISKIFNAKTKETVWTGGEEQTYMATVEKILPINPSNNAELIANIENELQENIRRDLREQFANAIRTKFDVTINKKPIEKMFYQSQ